MPRFSNPVGGPRAPTCLVALASLHAAQRAALELSPQAHQKPMTETVALKIVQRIATELTVQPRQVAAAVQLLDEGSTVPFIARYRKEVTGNLDDTQLRNLEERLLYLRELEDRRATILAQHRRARQAHRRTARRDRRRRQQAGARRPLSPVQAEAPHARADRPRSRARTARARRCSPIRSSIRKPKPRSSSTPRRASRT